MRRTRVTRINLLLERDKLTVLRRTLRARSNSEAVRITIDERLAIKGIQDALRGLRTSGTLEDVFNRVPAKRK